jgi:hypothetical protein
MGEIFHGGCLGCTNQEFYDLVECVDCMYYKFDAFSTKPNNYKSEKLTKEYDPVTDSYYALKPDEKIVHYQENYELDENGRAFQPMHTRIVKKNNALNTVWDSRDEKLPSYEVDHMDITHMGQKFRIAGHRTEVPDYSGSVAEWVEPPKEFGLVDELQKETDEWLVGVV